MDLIKLKDSFCSVQSHPGARMTQAEEADKRVGDTDWKGLWYKLEEEVSGEFIGMRARRYVAGQSSVDWIFLSHHRHDGFSGLAHVLKELGCTAVLGETRRPSLLSRTMALLRYIAKAQYPAAPWKSLNRSWRPPPGGTPATRAIATRALDVDRTMCLTDRARRLGVSLNSLLLSALATASRPELEAGPAVNGRSFRMRGASSATTACASCTSTASRSPRDGCGSVCFRTWASGTASASGSSLRASLTRVQSVSHVAGGGRGGWRGHRFGERWR